MASLHEELLAGAEAACEEALRGGGGRHQAVVSVALYQEDVAKLQLPIYVLHDVAKLSCRSMFCTRD